MQYQRKHKGYKSENLELTKENNNIKKIIPNRTIENMSTEKKTTKITTKPINISTIKKKRNS